MSLLKNSFFSDGLCIDESKVSVLIIAFIINTLTITTISFLSLKMDISRVPIDVLQNIHFALIVAISGVNLSTLLTRGK